MFVSGSQDKTVRFWDLRTRGCVNMVTPVTAPGNRVSHLYRNRHYPISLAGLIKTFLSFASYIEMVSVRVVEHFA